VLGLEPVASPTTPRKAASRMHGFVERHPIKVECL